MSTAALVMALELKEADRRLVLSAMVEVR